MALPNRTPPSLLNFLTGLVQFSTCLQLYKKLPITNEKIHFLTFTCTVHQRLSQDLETGCLRLAVVNFLGIQIFKGDHNILIFPP